MFEDLNLENFQKTFETNENCLLYLRDLKWGKGYTCRRCGHNKCWTGRTGFHKRCNKCDYDESPTANTVFHKIHFPLVKAFLITYYVTVLKKGVSCKNLAEVSGIGLKSVWLFRRKIQEVMGHCVSGAATGMLQAKDCSVDGIILTHREKNLNGLQRVTITLQKSSSGKKCSYIRFANLDPDPVVINACSLAGGRYVREGKDLLIWNFKAWLTGTHHHCSKKYLQGYLDEYSFKINHRDRNLAIWKALISQMVHLNCKEISRSAA